MLKKKLTEPYQRYFTWECMNETLLKRVDEQKIAIQDGDFVGEPFLYYKLE